MEIRMQKFVTLPEAITSQDEESLMVRLLMSTGLTAVALSALRSQPRIASSSVDQFSKCPLVAAFIMTVQDEWRMTDPGFLLLHDHYVAMQCKSYGITDDVDIRALQYTIPNMLIMHVRFQNDTVPSAQYEQIRRCLAVSPPTHTSYLSAVWNWQNNVQRLIPTEDEDKPLKRAYHNRKCHYIPVALIRPTHRETCAAWCNLRDGDDMVIPANIAGAVLTPAQFATAWSNFTLCEMIRYFEWVAAMDEIGVTNRNAAGLISITFAILKAGNASPDWLNRRVPAFLKTTNLSITDGLISSELLRTMYDSVISKLGKSTIHNYVWLYVMYTQTTEENIGLLKWAIEQCVVYRTTLMMAIAGACHQFKVSYGTLLKMGVSTSQISLFCKMVYSFGRSRPVALIYTDINHIDTLRKLDSLFTICQALLLVVKFKGFLHESLHISSITKNAFIKALSKSHRNPAAILEARGFKLVQTPNAKSFRLAPINQEGVPQTGEEWAASMPENSLDNAWDIVVGYALSLGSQLVWEVDRTLTTIPSPYRTVPENVREAMQQLGCPFPPPLSAWDSPKLPERKPIPCPVDMGCNPLPPLEAKHQVGALGRGANDKQSPPDAGASGAAQGDKAEQGAGDPPGDPSCPGQLQPDVQIAGSCSDTAVRGNKRVGDTQPRQGQPDSKKQADARNLPRRSPRLRSTRQ